MSGAEAADLVNPATNAGREALEALRPRVGVMSAPIRRENQFVGSTSAQVSP